LTLTIVTISMIAVPFYQDYASLFRNNRYVRDLIVPINYVYALQSYGKQFLPENIVRYQEIGTDAHLGPSYTQTRKRSVSVLIVGETARSASFSLYDYRRETTPLLAKQDIISFSQFSSCGTATAVSLPCMFSRLNRDNYKKSIATSSDNLLDVVTA
jgi:lipid A ethanolaminephosphotransferase